MDKEGKQILFFFPGLVGKGGQRGGNVIKVELC